MKTIKEWLSELPEPYKTQAFKYDDFKSHWDIEKPTAHEALSHAFVYSRTKEGIDYWWNLYEKLQNGEI